MVRRIVLAVGVLGLGATSLLPAWTPAGRAARETYAVDPVHSCVLFKIRHMNVADFYGRFNDFSGELVLDEADPAASSVRFEVQVASVDTNNEQRDTHLRSAEFFANQAWSSSFPTNPVAVPARHAYSHSASVGKR